MGEHNQGADTPGGLPQEEVKDRPSVGTVRPEDYPREKAGAQSDKPIDADKEYERLNPGSDGVVPPVPGRPRQRDNA